MVKVEPEPSLTGLGKDEKCVPTVTFCLPHVEHTIVDIETDKVNGKYIFFNILLHALILHYNSIELAVEWYLVTILTTK